ncbi:MAG: GntR family transcriptional regulator, partial [Candidatus Dormiibacterota bacterium]
MEGQGPRLAPLLNRQLGAAAFEALRRSLILPGWRPGQQLNLGQLTAQLGVSETPLKEALRRLAQQGLLEIRPRQGTFVRPLTERSLAQAIEARLLIEPWALGVIHERASAGDWARLDGIQASADALAARDGEAGTLDRYAAFTELDASFHLALVGACQNDSLAQLYESLGTHYLLARAT